MLCCNEKLTIGGGFVDAGRAQLPVTRHDARVSGVGVYDEGMPARPPDALLHCSGLVIELTWKPIKSFRLRVVPPDGAIKVSAPPYYGEEDVERIVEANLPRILEARQQMRLRPGPEELRDGGRARLWGRWCEVRFVGGERAAARLVDGVLEVAGGDEETRRRGLDALYKRELREALVELQPLWEAAAGRKAARIKLRRMKTRWGTCNTRSGDITLSVALAEHDPAALEYVLVHELTHLHERGHGPVFKAWMDRILPDWRARKRLLEVAA